jgi:hypothetical protein
LSAAAVGITAAARVTISDVGELVDTCSWIDWAKVLDDERVVITTAGTAVVPARGPRSEDRPVIRVRLEQDVTVGGGLMGQVTHIAPFDSVCTPQGLHYYPDDLPYTWGRSHNGFEASRLAPDLERRRLTRLVSQDRELQGRGGQDQAPMGLQPVPRLLRLGPPGGHGGHP